jgi:hypothetical protein
MALGSLLHIEADFGSANHIIEKKGYAFWGREEVSFFF